MSGCLLTLPMLKIVISTGAREAQTGLYWVFFSLTCDNRFPIWACRFCQNPGKTWTKSRISFQVEPSECSTPLTYRGTLSSLALAAEEMVSPSTSIAIAVRTALLIQAANRAPQSDFKPLEFKCQMPLKGNDYCFLSRSHSCSSVTRTSSSYFPF